MVGRQSEELWSSRGSCLAHKILIVVGLVGVAPTTQLVPFFSFESVYVSGLWLPPHVVATQRPLGHGCFDHSLL